jgi:hypothetical protein
LLAHWDKRNHEAVDLYNPAGVDNKLLSDLAARYARPRIEGDVTAAGGVYSFQPVTGEYPFIIDEFKQSGIRGPEDIRDIFVNQFYFGCEGDDPLNAMAFDTPGIPLAPRFNALYGSDIGHWDVPDMREIVEEAYELVEHGLISDDDLRIFVFGNAVRFWTAGNPDFFKGTAVESDVKRFLAIDTKP